MSKGSQTEVLETSKGQQPEVLMTVHEATYDAGLNPEGIFRITESNGIVAEGIRQLPPPLRVALQLFELDGLSAAESSQVLGIFQGAFNSRVNRARQKLAKRLQHSFHMPANTLLLEATEIPISEIAFSSQSRTNHSPAFGYATCQ